MIDLAAAAVLTRELTEQHLEGEPRPPKRKPKRRSWILRVASAAVTQRRTEETWPPRKSRTSAC